jgi:phosphoribosyl 1,2-cyclic phosphodiesterase
MTFSHSGGLLASIGSGSRGNGTLVFFEDTCLLIDCGFSLKETQRRLTRCGVDPAELTAILVTHEHSDHASGVAALSHRFNTPVYLSYGSLRSMPDLDSALAKPFNSDETFAIDGVLVDAVAVPHDAREPTQFVLRSCSQQIGVITDVGHITPHVIDRFRGCTGLFMESNHDTDMLMRGDYPARLKRRISGALGHLSNEQASEFLGAVVHDGLSHVVVGHISEQNNSRTLLEETFERFRPRVGVLQFATQDLGIEWAAVG